MAGRAVWAPSRRRALRASTRIGLSLLALVAVAALTACGSSKKKNTQQIPTPTPAHGGLPITVADAGKGAKFTVPKRLKGGVTAVSLTNRGKRPHAAQLLLVKGKHTVQDVLEALSPSSTGKSEWLRAEGGVGAVAPGKVAAASVRLPAGHYVVADTANQNGPPSHAELDVTKRTGGSLPKTPTAITAATAGKDRYAWKVSGPLKLGPQDVTFKSEGKEALHFIQAVHLIGKPSRAQIEKAIASHGKPPAFVDEKSFYTSAILDGGRSQVTSVDFSSAGSWVLFCSLSDRGEKKEHFKEGLLKIVTVKQ